ncbi:MAG: phospholipid carrier-dependent glycosyltransferase [Anaerolineae bacterium]|nr:phospholipid carrier-dependent glycosyltransferase [Anaerolineae bacterium]
MKGSHFWGQPLWWGTAVLLLLFALALTSMKTLAPTFDEQGFIVRGLAYVRGENRHMRVGHPLGLNALNASLLAGDNGVALPTTDPFWSETSFHRPAELFLWEIGNDVAHVMFLARLPTIWLALLLAALVGRWAWQMTGDRWAGLLALTLIALDPNILANAGLATTDLGLAFGAVVAGFTLWRYWLRPSPAMAIVAGIGFGLLQNTKFTAGLFVPLFALVILSGILTQWRHHHRHGRAFPWRVVFHFILLYPLAAFVTLWAAYGFQVGTLPASLPTFPQLAGLTVPLSHHIEQLLDIGGRLQVETPSFLMGQYSRTGWWYYFPVAFLLKTPLPTLVLLVTAVILRILYYMSKKAVFPRSSEESLCDNEVEEIPPLRLVGMTDSTTRNPDHRLPITAHESRLTDSPLFNDAALLIPALGYFAIALTSEINLGYRHLLPVLPFTAVFIAHALANPPNHKPDYRLRITNYGLRLTLTITFTLLTLLALWIHPHYLSYFNLLAGGPDNGWRYLVDSNTDWGQDVNRLKGWMDENGVETVWLSYFGEARPEYYGISYQGLDSWPPRLMNPQARPYYSANPAPGIYAISATNLQGVHFANHDQFAWFREREPLAKLGYSIFLYEVPATGGPVDVVLAGLQLDEIVPADYAQFNSNDVTPRWVDPATAVIVPHSPRGWLVLAQGAAVAPPIAALITSWPLRLERDAYTFYQIPSLAVPSAEPLARFNQGGGQIELVSAFVDTAVPGQPLLINTAWQQKSDPQPIKIFIHLLDDQGNIAAQWDGLGAAWEGWQPGDALLHSHTIPLPDNLPPGTYEVRLGLYHPQTGQRWLVETGADYVVLRDVEVGE